MKRLLRAISRNYVESDPDDRKLSSFIEMRSHPGWETMQELIYNIRNSMAEDMLTEAFTKLPPDEKDTRQRAYAHVTEILKFLVNPLELAIKRAEFSRGIDKMMGTTVRK